jgi:hypothetical protein
MKLEVLSDLEGVVTVDSLIVALKDAQKDGFDLCEIKEVPHGYDGRMVLVVSRKEENHE